MSGAKSATNAIVCQRTKIWKPEPASTAMHFAGLWLVWWWLLVAGFNGGTASALAADDRRPGYSSSEHDEVEALVRQWAPMVWLAPGEQFMPGNVNDFLRNVHAEKSTMAAASQHTADILNVDDMLLYEIDREIGKTEEESLRKMMSSTSVPPEQHEQPNNAWHRQQPAPPIPRPVRMERVIDLPIGRRSLDWFLTANGDVDGLLEDETSFLYGQDPNVGNVPVYAVVNMCDASPTDKQSENDIKYHDRIARTSYIPLNIQADAAQRYRLVRGNKRKAESSNRPKRDTTVTSMDGGSVGNKPPKTVALSLGTSFSINATSVHAIKNPPEPATPSSGRIPQFHVTYWLFYPYNQGKTICTINLGPLGRLPIPQLFGKCLGTRRDFGSHVGDWEHMTLYFRAGHRREPTEMYVSAHDAGAYYTYERLSGSFEFRRQETRNNHILQQAIFPKTVRTVGNGHPVLFSALGSHGLWVAPGRHRFVRVPRLVDVNGFGTPWYTWKNVEFSYDNRQNRAVRRASGGLMEGPKWLRYMGRWGNSQSKCHPLKRLGLNFCEYNDGPTGIPLKEQHFVCKQ